jgi:XapX domain-containing protein
MAYIVRENVRCYMAPVGLAVALSSLEEGWSMKAYVLSLLAGILVGVVYSLIGVTSPAPPIVALVGLLGILAGEQIFPVAKKMLSGANFRLAWKEEHCDQHLFGSLPGRNSGSPRPMTGVTSEEKRS